MSIMCSRRGFSLVELTAVIVVIGILASIAIKSATSSLRDARRVKTEREMHKLASAIMGRTGAAAALDQGDFGYVGDIGAFPADLADLVTNPGYSTWDGPYFRPEFDGDTLGCTVDEWGQPYTYSPASLVSNGGGSPITLRLADNDGDYLRNRYSLIVRDANDSLPGTIKKDSVLARVTIPDGLGSTTTKSYRPSGAGLIELDSLPVGQHALELIYQPANDTISRYIAVLPRHRSQVPSEIKFAGVYFGQVYDPALTKVTSSDSITSYGPACNGLIFWIRNNTGAAKIVSSVRLTFATPTAYYRYVKWDGSTVVNSNSPRVGSGQTATFSSNQTIQNGQTARIQVEGFKATASGSGADVNMQSCSITVLFSDGSTVNVAIGACP